jgi:putative ribosome biogenesis GTPase RsgA
VIAVPELPYRGIHPYRYVDHRIFFAREEETRDLLRLAVVYRGVMLYGDSGAGKSSLINAGLIPAAIRKGFQPERGTRAASRGRGARRRTDRDRGRP